MIYSALLRIHIEPVCRLYSVHFSEDRDAIIHNILDKC